MNSNPLITTPRISGAFIGAILTSFLAASAWSAPNLTVGTASGQAGSVVDIPITFDPTLNSVAGIQFNLTLPSGLSTGAVTPGAIVTAAAKNVSTNLVGNTWTFIVFGLNQNLIGAGSLLTAQLRIAAGTAAGSLSLPVSGVVYSDPSGASIVAGTSTGGSVTVQPPPPVITSAATATGQVGVAFSYQITASNSPASFNATGLPTGLSINTATGLISGTPSAAGSSNITLSATNAGGTGTRILALSIDSACDINRDAATNAIDLQLMVNQAIGITACSSDINKDLSCNVIDVQRVVNAALGGACVVGP